VKDRCERKALPERVALVFWHTWFGSTQAHDSVLMPFVTCILLCCHHSNVCQQQH
jgi:hypothetical protein